MAQTHLRSRPIDVRAGERHEVPRAAIHIANVRHVIEHFRCGITNGTSPESMTSAYFPAQRILRSAVLLQQCQAAAASMCVSISMAAYRAATVKSNVLIATPFSINVPVIPALVAYSTLGAGGASTLN